LRSCWDFTVDIVFPVADSNGHWLRVVKVEIVVLRGLGALLEAHAIAMGVTLPELGAVPLVRKEEAVPPQLLVPHPLTVRLRRAVPLTVLLGCQHQGGGEEEGEKGFRDSVHAEWVRAV